MAGKYDPPVDKRILNLEGPRFGVSAVLVCSVNRRITIHLCWSGFVAGPRAAVASKESEDPNELRGVKSLLSGLLVEFSVLAKVLSQRK